MRHALRSVFFSVAAAFVGVWAGCSGDEEGGNDCQPGTELCACVSGQCFGNLTCDPVMNLCVSSGGGTGDTGGGVEAEQGLCDRLDECNFLEPGVSANDCRDQLKVCTNDLISSAYSDWEKLANDCLDLSNCKNFFECQATLPDCVPAGGGGGGGGCVNDGNPCDYCWGGQTCSAGWFGDGECDCECANGTDPDCF